MECEAEETEEGERQKTAAIAAAVAALAVAAWLVTTKVIIPGNQYKAAEAEEMRMKGYTYQQETARQIGLEAMKNGLVGEGGGALGGIGDLAGLGIGLGAMGSVIGVTKDAVSPLFSDAGQAVQGAAIPDIPAPAAAGTWDCACGQKGLTGKFCPECGKRKGE